MLTCKHPVAWKVNTFIRFCFHWESALRCLMLELLNYGERIFFSIQKGGITVSLFLSSQILFDQAQRSIKTQLQTFVKE